MPRYRIIVTTDVDSEDYASGLPDWNPNLEWAEGLGHAMRLGDADWPSDTVVTARQLP